MGDILIVMNSGRIEQIGAPMEIYRRPATAFVAAFIGSPPMNMLPAVAEGGELVIGDSLRLTAPWPNGGGAMTVGIRPEHLEFADPDTATIRLPVSIVEPQGAETLVHGELNGHPLTARIHGAIEIRGGETLPLRLAPEHVHLFNEAEGVRLN